MTEIQNPKRVWKIGYCKFDIYLSFGACNLVFFASSLHDPLLTMDLLQLSVS
jgi:hypothetical protein